MLFEAIVGLFAAMGIFFLLQSIKSYIYSPVPTGENIRLETIICVGGDATNLEQTAKSLRQLYGSAEVKAEIIIKDCGMDTETARRAEKLAAQKGIKIII